MRVTNRISHTIIFSERERESKERKYTKRRITEVSSDMNREDYYYHYSVTTVHLGSLLEKTFYVEWFHYPRLKKTRIFLLFSYFPVCPCFRYFFFLCFVFRVCYNFSELKFLFFNAIEKKDSTFLFFNFTFIFKL